MFHTTIPTAIPRPTMRGTMRVAVIGAATALLSAASALACASDTEVRSSTPDGPAWRMIDAALAGCGVQVDAASPHIIGLDNDTQTAMSRARTLRPLNDLLKASSIDIAPERLVMDDWRVAAIISTVETRHLMYRRDILEAANLPPPKSYGEILRVSAQLRAVGVTNTPFAVALLPGDDMAQTYIDVYLGMGGTLFLPGFDASIYNPRGVATMEMMQMLAGFAPADYLKTDANMVEERLIAGDIAMAVLSSDRAARIIASSGGKIAMAPAPISGRRPAATLRWTGLGVSNEATDAEAAAAFRAITEGISADLARSNATTATWLIDGYEPQMPGAAAVQTAREGALTYPAGPEMSLLRDAIGVGVEPFLKGTVDPAVALLDIELVYKRAAREQGMIN
jgi:ABC-type glycerol-3-phosphate transport system substrate-binding protein